MGVVSGIGRCLLVTINVLFMLVCLTFVALGLLIRYVPAFVQPDAVLNTIESKVKAAFLDQQNTFNTSEFDIGLILNDVALMFIILGFILLTFCFFGCCGACFNVKFMLLTYALIISILLVAEIDLVILAFDRPETLKKLIVPALRDSLSDYQGLNGTNSRTVAWNYMMIEFECCGPVDYKDFTNIASWWARGVAVTPWACCKTLPNSFGAAEVCANHNHPHDGVGDLDGINTYAQGCVDAMWHRVVESNKTWLIGVISCCFLFQTLLVIFAMVLFLEAYKKKKVDHSDDVPRRSKREDRRDHAW